MISTVFVCTGSGLVLFCRDFAPASSSGVNGAGGGAGYGHSKQRMLGGLLSAMLEFSVVTAGMRLCYMELSGLGVTIVATEAAKSFCALFHDRDDGPELHSLIATEILNAFHDDYGTSLGADSALKDFNSFHAKLGDVVQGVVQPVLERLRATRGIQRVVFVVDGNSIYQTDSIDQLGVLANLQALMGHSTDIMTHCNDHAKSIMLDGSGDNNSLTLIWRIQGGMLVVSASKISHSSKYHVNMEESIRLLNKLAGIVAGIRGAVH
jgi:hypothetical protein